MGLELAERNIKNDVLTDNKSPNHSVKQNLAAAATLRS
jgi:hypothetical protein